MERINVVVKKISFGKALILLCKYTSNDSDFMQASPSGMGSVCEATFQKHQYLLRHLTCPSMQRGKRDHTISVGWEGVGAFFHIEVATHLKRHDDKCFKRVDHSRPTPGILRLEFGSAFAPSPKHLGPILIQFCGNISCNFTDHPRNVRTASIRII